MNGVFQSILSGPEASVRSLHNYIDKKNKAYREQILNLTGLKSDEIHSMIPGTGISVSMPAQAVAFPDQPNIEFNDNVSLLVTFDVINIAKMLCDDIHVDVPDYIPGTCLIEGIENEVNVSVEDISHFLRANMECNDITLAMCADAALTGDSDVPISTSLDALQSSIITSEGKSLLETCKTGLINVVGRGYAAGFSSAASFLLSPQGSNTVDSEDPWSVIDNASSFTGVSPYIMLLDAIDLSHLVDDFKRFVKLAAKAVGYVVDVSLSLLDKASTRFWNWYHDVMGESKTWGYVNGTPMDLSWDNMYFHEEYHTDSMSFHSQFPNITNMLLEHVNEILVIPTLGATYYCTMDDSQDHNVKIYMARHCYNQNSDQIVGVASINGNTMEDVARALATTDLALKLNPDNTSNNAGWDRMGLLGMTYANQLIQLGLCAISGEDIRGRYYQDADPEEVNMSKRRFSKVYAYYGDFVTQWGSKIHVVDDENGELNNDQINNGTFFKMANTMLSENTILSVYRALDSFAAIVNGDDGSYIPYYWSTVPNTGYVQVFTDRDLADQLKDVLIKTAAAAGVIVVTVAAIAIAKRLKRAAFNAQRLSDIALYDKSVSDADAYKLSKRARLLGKLAGVATAPVGAIGSFSQETAETTLTEVNNIRFLITG